MKAPPELKKNAIHHVSAIFRSVLAERGFHIGNKRAEQYRAERYSESGFYPLVTLLDTFRSLTFSYDLRGGVQHPEFLRIAERTIPQFDIYKNIPIVHFWPESKVNGAKYTPNQLKVLRSLMANNMELNAIIRTTADKAQRIGVIVRNIYKFTMEHLSRSTIPYK